MYSDTISLQNKAVHKVGWFLIERRNKIGDKCDAIVIFGTCPYTNVEYCMPKNVTAQIPCGLCFLIADVCWFREMKRGRYKGSSLRRGLLTVTE